MQRFQHEAREAKPLQLRHAAQVQGKEKEPYL